MKDLFNRKKHTFFLLHILCWGIVFCGPFFPPNNISSSETSFAIKYFVKMGMVFCFFYLNYFVLIDKFLFNKKFSKFIVSNLLLITLFATLTQIFFKLFDSCSQSVEYISLNQKTQILHDSHTQADSKHIEYFLLSCLCYDENDHKSNSLFGYLACS